MFRRRILQMVLLGIKQFRDPYYQGFAAQISFYLMLSIVPMFLLMTRLLDKFNINITVALDWIVQYTGKEISQTLSDLLSPSAIGGWNIVLVVVAVWSASRAQFCVMRISNYTITEGKNTGKGYWRERFRAVATMLITLLTIAFSLIILVYGENILKLVTNLLELDKTLTEETLGSIWMFIRWVLGFALYFLMISYNYYIMPEEKSRFRDILPGSIFAAVGMLLVTLLYAEYVGSMANYDLIYGALASIVALMFWFYFLAWVLCLGILFNKVWGDTAQLTKRKMVPHPSE
ncbi:MAG: YihY/virulence factor BrkB family protein [Anaerovoracaceae bacterium]